MHIVSPKIVSIHTVDTSSLESIIETIIEPGMTPEEKAIAIWRFCWEHTYHWPAPKENDRRVHEFDVVYDALKLLNVYGYTYCYAIRSLGEALWEAAGMEGRSGGIGGHVLAEVYYEGRYHLLDHDQRGFSRLPDGTIASMADYRGRPELVLDPPGPSEPFFPAGTAPRAPYEQKHIFAGYMLNQHVHYRQFDKYRTTHPMHLGLRPGERFIGSWDNVGKWQWYPAVTNEYKRNGYGDPWTGPRDPYGELYDQAPRDEDGRPLTYGNGLLIYRPDLGSGARDLEDGVCHSENIDNAGQGFGPSEPKQPARADFRVRLPYIIVGWPGNIAAEDTTITGAAVVSGRCRRRTNADRINLLLSTDEGASWKTVWKASETGEFDFAVDLSQHVAGRYGYRVRLELASVRQPGDARILDLGVDTACQLNPKTLPAVRPGRNEMTVSLQPGPNVYEQTIQYTGTLKQAHDRLVRKMNGLRLQTGRGAALCPDAGKSGHVVYEMAAPEGEQVAWAKVGGSFRCSRPPVPEERFRIYYAVDEPTDWALLDDVDPAPYLGHWCFETNHDIPLPRPGQRVFIKFELARGQQNGGKLCEVRLVWGCQSGQNRAPRGGLQVTHRWRQGGKQLDHTGLVTRKSQSYRFDVDEQKVRNQSLMLEWAARPPVSDGPHPLMSTPPDVQRREIRDIEKIEAMRADIKRLDRDPTIETAADIIWNSKGDWIRDSGITAMIAIGGEDARRELKKAMKKKRKWARGLYLELLVREGPTAELVAEFETARGEERAKIADLLALRNDHAALPALRKAIESEHNKEILAAELDALVRIGGPDVAEDAVARRKDCDTVGRGRVDAALAKAGACEGLSGLSRMLDHRDRYLRYRAASGLAECGRQEAEPGLIQALSDESRWVRQAATAGLGRIGTRKALPALRRVAKSDPHAYIRAEADWAIGRIDER